jgi:hypothetical protein
MVISMRFDPVEQVTIGEAGQGPFRSRGYCEHVAGVFGSQTASAVSLAFPFEMHFMRPLHQSNRHSCCRGRCTSLQIAARTAPGPLNSGQLAGFKPNRRARRRRRHGVQ